MAGDANKSDNFYIRVNFLHQGELGAGAAGTVYRVKHKIEGGEVVFSIQLDLFVIVLCIFNCQ